MLTLAVIVQNPAAATAIIGFGVVILALVLALSLALWVVVARGRARRAAQDFDDSETDPGLEALRQRRLVVQSTPKARGRDDTVVSKLEPIGDTKPVAH